MSKEFRIFLKNKTANLKIDYENYIFKTKLCCQMPCMLKHKIVIFNAFNIY